MQFEQKATQTSDYEVKKYSGQVVGYSELQFQMSVKEQNRKKEDKFRQRLDDFKNISTLEEAKELARRVMPIKDGRTIFRVGEAKCIVINKKDLLKITFDSKNEFINFCFV